MIKKTFTLLLALAVLAMGFLVWQGYQDRRQITEKKNIKAEEIRLTFIEGWTAADMASYLEKQGIAKKDDFNSAQRQFTSENFRILASKPASAGLEGFLFPDTYNIYKPKNNFETGQAKTIIEKMLVNFQNKFTPAMEMQALNKRMSIYQILTLASIIEKEAGLTADGKDQLDRQRKIIAGIFYSRMALGMPLQSDATINYITKKNDASASEVDLQNDSPYNTYKYKGLPPGPICNPSLSSITAALYPASTDYLYFLHSQKSGEIIYSKTFEEHIKNKLRYLNN